MKKELLGADCDLLGSDDLMVQAVATLDTFDECAVMWIAFVCMYIFVFAHTHVGDCMCYTCYLHFFD
jgi:hypothetical protein